MDFKQWLMNEMPVTAFNLHGNLSPLQNKPFDKATDPIPGYEPSDIPFLTQQHRVQDMIKKWSNTKQNYELHFVSSEQAAQHVEVGQVTAQWVQKNIGIQIKKNPGVITVIFTNNVGLERVPMTPWIIAHRLGHVLEKAGGMNQFEKILDDGFEKILRDVYRVGVVYQTNKEGKRNLILPSLMAMHQLAAAVGMMKSAGKLTKYYEFSHELFAQYIQTGRIQFKPLPQVIPPLSREAARYSGQGRQMTASGEGDAGELEKLSGQLQAEMDNLLGKMEGKIFVM